TASTPIQISQASARRPRLATYPPSTAPPS
ncbi:hypothetical protein TrRE_jg599, partial [Triparma retinervis]